MESLTKNHQKPDVILQLAKQAFGGNTEVAEAREINSGYFNAVYAVKLTDGREIILKIAPDKNVPILRLERKAMLSEVRAIQLIKNNTDVPVPDILYYDNTKEKFDFEYLFMEKLEGEEFSSVENRLAPKYIADIKTQIGEYAQKIHSIKGSAFGYFLEETGWRETWQKAFLMMTGDVLKDGRDKGVELPAPYGEFEKVFGSFSQLLGEVKEARLVHWDLWHGNILVKDGEITGIIDMERALWGDPLMETYFIGFYDTSYFIKGYGADPVAGDECQIRRCLYNLHFYIMAIINYAYRRGSNLEDNKYMRDLAKNTLEFLQSVL